MAGADIRIVVVSDIHYAGALERQRRDFEDRGVPNKWLRPIARAYRRFVWLKDPLSHYHRLDIFLKNAPEVDFAIGLGDYSCDTGFVGVSDDAAFDSAKECLRKLKEKFNGNFAGVIGDHELGKLSLFGGVGGMRVASFYRAVNELGLKPFWKIEFGRFVLIGVTSSVVALNIFKVETLPEELPEWEKIYRQHIKDIQNGFSQISPHQKIILLCHDPSALAYLAELPEVNAKLPQFEMTVIGHLHSRAVFNTSRYLAGMPQINFLGHTPRRLSKALSRARIWRMFKTQLCPSLSGIQLFKDGGYCVLQFNKDSADSVALKFHHLPW